MKLPTTRPLDFCKIPRGISKITNFCTPEECQIAFALLDFCMQNFSKGRIKNCKNWTKREWNLLAMCPKKITKNCENLWHFEGDDLVVDIYDAEAENAVLSKRKTYSDNASARWKKRSQPPPTAHAIAYPIADATADATAMQSIENRVKRENVGGGYTTVDIESHVAKPSPPEKKEKPSPSAEEYTAWLVAFTTAIPTLAEYKTLPDKIAAAAHAAYLTFPTAKNYAPLLAAYYADTKLKEDSYAKKFWRPTGDLLFANLSDVIHNHAERWGKYTGWFRKQRKAALEKCIQNTLTHDNDERIS